LTIFFRFEALAKLNKHYFVRNTREFCLLADSLEGIPSFQLIDHFNFSLAPLKIPINERKAINKLAILKSFAEQFTSLRKVTLPKEYHLSHSIFTKTSFQEDDLELYESLHNGKLISI
jgi:hypothetical protein